MESVAKTPLLICIILLIRVMVLPDKRFFTHRRINDLLSVLVAGVAIYILLLPAVPFVQLWLKEITDQSGGYVYQTNLADKNENTERKPIPKENRLVLPTIQLDQEIHEGERADTMSKGLWRRPNTSTPDKGGNTVIVGHRFTYSDPAVLFHLDKIKLGDTFPVYWQGKEYDYKVNDIQVVSPLAVEVENPTPDPTLTIYTCTPVWTGTDRLVVKASLLKEESL